MSSRRLSTITSHIHPQTTLTTPPSSSSTTITPSPTIASDEAGLAGYIQDTYYTFTKPVEFSQKKHGGHLVAKVLQSHGVKWIFTLSGGHISPVLVACEDIGIKIIDTRHEVNAVFAADAVSRYTGVPGVAAVTAGPGVTNAVTACKNAQMAESALILLGGAAATLTKGRGALQDVEQIGVLKSVCKYTISITSARDIVPAMRRAFREALSGIPGPVFVELPLDVLYPVVEVQANMGLSERKYKKDLKPEDMKRIMLPSEYKDVDSYLKSLKPLEAVFLESLPNPNADFSKKVVDSYMRYSLKSIFAGAWDTYTDYSPLPVSIPQPNNSQVDQTIQFIKSSQRPILVIGSQATLGGPMEVEKLATAVKRLGIPTFLGGMARGLLGASSTSLQIRQERGKALKNADLIILLGTVCDFRLNYGRELPPASKCKIVSVNRSKANATMNAGMFWFPVLVCESDPALFLRSIMEKMGNHLDSTSKRFVPWLVKLREAQDKKDHDNIRKSKEKAIGRVEKWNKGPTKPDDEHGPELINPLALCCAIEDVLPDNAIVILDGGDFVATASYIIKPRGPLQHGDPGAFGTLGIGGGFAIGAKLARPDAEVWLLWGDGSSGYSLAEFDTMARFGIPIIAVIGNDAAWNQIEREQVPMFQRDSACALAYCKYEDVARGYGGDGISIRDPKLDLKKVLNEVREKVKNSGVPMVVNAHIGRTNFREGSLSV
jgi:acetolactate synthase-like protein